jgi:hypothetical protein
MNWREAFHRQRRFPTLERFGRWLFSWRSVKAALFVIAALATVAALFYGVENWRGRYAWKKYRQAAERKGARFDFNALIPPPVPDDQNFAMTPLLKPLLEYERGPDFTVRWRDTNGWQALTRLSANGTSRASTAPHFGDWTAGVRIDLEAWQRFYRNEPPKEKKEAGRRPPRAMPPVEIKPEDAFPTAPQRQSPATDVLLALTKFDAELKEITSAAQRPYCRFAIHYDESFSTLLPHLSRLTALANLFQLRAVALLAATNSDAAFSDVQTLLRLADAPKDEPFLISELVRLSILTRALQPVWEGTCDHRWSDAQLAQLQKQFAAIDIESEGIRMFNAARAHGTASFQQIMANRRNGRVLKAWADMFPVYERRDAFMLYLRYAPSGWFLQSQIVLNRRLDAIAASLEAGRAGGVVAPVNMEVFDHRIPVASAFDFLMSEMLTNSIDRFPALHVRLDLAEVACALERFHLAREKYPEALTELEPKFIARVPKDFMDGQPLRYRRVENRAFKVYSVGLDGKDDGGEFPPKNNSAAGDWVWAGEALAGQRKIE